MRYARSAVALLAAGLLTWLLFRGVQPAELAALVAHADPWWLAAGVGATLAITWARTLRWQLLLGAERQVPLGPVLSTFLIGFLANTVAPMRLGDLLRAYLLGELTPVSKLRVLASVVVEKVLDVVFLSLALLLVLLLGPFPAGLRAPLGTVVAGGFLGLLGLVVVAAHERQTVDWLAAAGRHWPLLGRAGIQRRLEPFLAGLGVLREGRLLPGVLALSLASWGLTAAANLVVLRAMRISVPLLAAAGLILVVTNLGMVVPSPIPGYIGVFQWLVWLALAPFGVEQGPALAYGIVLYVVSFGPLVLGGAVCLWLGQHHLGDLQRRALGQGAAGQVAP